MRRLLVTLALLASPATASAQPDGARVVDASGRSAVQARAGETVELTVALRDRRGRLGPLPDGAEVRWLRVRPHMQHEDTPPQNEGIRQYSNSVLFGPDHGRWIGLDSIEYETVALEARPGVEPAGRTLRLRASPDRDDGAGTLWIAAEVTLPGGAVVRTPDGDDRDRLGLVPSVMRVSFRAGDGLLGWLSTFFGVPNVFGSTRGQVERYVGADCADVLIGAARASGRRDLGYTSVVGIGRHARPVTGALLLHDDGRVTDEEGTVVTLRWGEDLRSGDLFAIDYARPGSRLPRAWDHIGALTGDTDGDGRLGGADRLRHMTPLGLVDWPIEREAPIRFRVWRLHAR